MTVHANAVAISNWIQKLPNGKVYNEEPSDFQGEFDFENFEELDDHWEDVRWFLAIHYAFNRKLDTPFWEYCRAETDIGDARERVELFQERAPLTYRQSLFYKTEAVFGDFAYDALLLGQGVSARFLDPQEKRSEWQKRNTGLKNLAATCISQAEALELLEAAPEHVLQGVVSKPETWASWP